MSDDDDHNDDDHDDSGGGGGGDDDDMMIMVSDDDAGAVKHCCYISRSRGCLEWSDDRNIVRRQVPMHGGCEKWPKDVKIATFNRSENQHSAPTPQTKELFV